MRFGHINNFEGLVCLAEIGKQWSDRVGGFKRFFRCEIERVLTENKHMVREAQHEPKRARHSTNDGETAARG